MGEDAQALDRQVRGAPEEAYEPSFAERVQAEGHFGGVDTAGLEV